MRTRNDTPKVLILVGTRSPDGNCRSYRLRTALRPGGLARAQPSLEAHLVSNLEGQAVIKGIPLKADDKRNLLRFLVKTSLDCVLEDLEMILAAPHVKLQTLESQKRQIQKYMSSWQLIRYRIRYYPVQMALSLASVAFIGYAAYQMTKHTAVVTAATTLISETMVHFCSFGRKVLKFLGLGTHASGKRRLVRKVMKR